MAAAFWPVRHLHGGGGQFAIIEVSIIVICPLPLAVFLGSFSRQPELRKAGGHVRSILENDAGERHQVAPIWPELRPGHHGIDGHRQDNVGEQVDFQRIDGAPVDTVPTSHRLDQFVSLPI